MLSCRSHCIITFLLCLILLPLYGENSYSSNRVKAVASLLNLKGLDTLKVGNNIDYTYNEKPLVIRVNQWHELEHIGYYLFNDSIKHKELYRVYDFLERYLLELNLVESTEYAIKLGFDNVDFKIGNFKTIYQLDGSENICIDSHLFDYYDVKWMKNGKTLLNLKFDMDSQLLLGENIEFLEKNYLKEVLRYRYVRPNIGEEQKNFHFPSNSDSFQKRGNSFIIDAIRNDLFYRKENGNWKLLSSIKNPSKSIANTLLSLETEGDYTLHVKLDMYGYTEQNFTVRLSDWLGKCLYDEMCVPYFGMKNKKDANYEATVFMVKEHLGYLHMLSVSFPEEVLRNKKGIISGRLFIYIPLHNVTKKIFNNTEYKEVSYEN